MPCRSDYMEASGTEKQLSRVLCLLDELLVHRPVDSHSKEWAGYHPGAYNHSGGSKELDRATAELCAHLGKLTKEQLSTYTLEMQLWWREHQKQDRKREAQEREADLLTALRKKALAKLTPEERVALKLEGGQE